NLFQSFLKYNFAKKPSKKNKKKRNTNKSVIETSPIIKMNTVIQYVIASLATHFSVSPSATTFRKEPTETFDEHPYRQVL
ncbi:hypothetical protein, partial [Pseudomonas amygdali]|uniref:hypothetical protein n=1 Tax=Pseudomonas amygdali TaxID=47877 RepID=UPI001EE4D4C6